MVISRMSTNVETDMGRLILKKRKRVFQGSVAVFTLSSLLFAISTNIYLLILFRFLQAAGGSSFMPSAMGGWILDVTPWQAIFLVNIPIGALILAYFILASDLASLRASARGPVPIQKMNMVSTGG